MHALLPLAFIALSPRPAFAQIERHVHAANGAFVLICAAVALGMAVPIFRRAWRSSREASVIGALVGSAACMGIAAVYLALGDAPFARHMLEQMVLMDAAAPLVAVIAARWFRVSPGWAALSHAVVMWGWHIPAVYAGIGTLPSLHIAMQASFLVVGIAFWSSILRAKGSRTGRALFWLFMTVMHTGFLGALLTFTAMPLYGAAIDDQQLGGAVMWVMGTAIYAIAALLVAARWLHVLDSGSLRERAA